MIHKDDNYGCYDCDHDDDDDEDDGDDDEDDAVDDDDDDDDDYDDDSVMIVMLMLMMTMRMMIVIMIINDVYWDSSALPKCFFFVFYNPNTNLIRARCENSMQKSYTSDTR